MRYAKHLTEAIGQETDDIHVVAIDTATSTRVGIYKGGCERGSWDVILRRPPHGSDWVQTVAVHSNPDAGGFATINAANRLLLESHPFRVAVVDA